MQNQKLNLRLFLICFLLILGSRYACAQQEKETHWGINGYVSSLQTAMMPGSWNNILLEQTIQNRVNIQYDPWKFMELRLELRNRLITGQFFGLYPDYDLMIAHDPGFLDLSDNLLRGGSTVFNARIDRAYVNFSFGKTELSIGRQRINWGQCFAWNPNDIFNTASFFDFDYEEKPGSDAVRLQIYPTATSGIELAIKADYRDRVTAAALYRFNRKQYDFQFLAGVADGKDLVGGMGWSGNISKAGFRGEVTYFHPMHHLQDTSGILVASVGSEYMFKNGLFIQLEALYNMKASDQNAFFFDDPFREVSARALSFTDYSVLLHLSYPPSPLWNLSLAAMYFPEKNGFYAGPTLSYSLSDNASASLISQIFGGQFRTQHMDYLALAFLRFKINF